MKSGMFPTSAINNVPDFLFFFVVAVHVLAHIFFDDAFTKETKRGEDCFAVNSFVKQFLDVVDEAARYLHVIPSLERIFAKLRQISKPVETLDLGHCMMTKEANVYYMLAMLRAKFGVTNRTRGCQ